MMDIIQAASGMYMLVVLIYFAVVSAHAVWQEGGDFKKVNVSRKLEGWAAWLFSVAMFVCAITTLAHV